MAGEHGRRGQGRRNAGHPQARRGRGRDPKRAGFSREGRLLALDMFVVQDNGPYEGNNDAGMSGRIVSLMYQPLTMRWRGVAVLTNTATRASQTAPGGMQGVTIMERVMAKASRRLGIDPVALHSINAPAGQAPFGPPGPNGVRPHAPSAFVREALSCGAETFGWAERKAKSGRRQGPKTHGVGVAVSGFVAGTVGYDGLVVIKPDGGLRFHCGVGNLGTESWSDVHRVAAQELGVPWERCEIVWGAQPLAHNGYKVDLLHNLVKRAILGREES